MFTTGVTGQRWRASISASGAIEPWGPTAALRWFVAADDRWHDPATEQTVRQQRIEGTPVAETRVRVPNGDVVQRIFSVADHGGLTIVELENESTMPVAIAFDRRDVLTDRPVADVPIEGIDLPDGAFVMPLGHRATTSVAVVHGEQRSGPIPAGIPAMMQVVRGWLSLAQRAGRYVLPEGERGAVLADAITGERCEIALGAIPQAGDDPVGFALALDQLVRMGEPPDHWMPELVDAVETLGPVPGWDADVALAAAQRACFVAGERRALRDLRRIVGRRVPTDSPPAPPGGVRSVAWLESRLVSGGAMLPHGLPSEWLGQSIDVYGVPTVPGSAVSFAIRWHGERPAVLWEQTGEAVELSAPAVAPEWSSSAGKGEALWPPPPRVASTVPASGLDGAEPSSFS